MGLFVLLYDIAVVGEALFEVVPVGRGLALEALDHAANVERHGQSKVNVAQVVLRNYIL